MPYKTTVRDPILQYQASEPEPGVCLHKNDKQLLEEPPYAGRLRLLFGLPLAPTKGMPALSVRIEFD